MDDDNYWTPEERARFHYVEIDGIRSPGVLQLPEMGSGIPRKWEQTNGPGLEGSFFRYNGLGCAEWSFTFRCVGSADRKIVDSSDWKKATEPSPQGQGDKKHFVKHPLLERKGIRECIIKNDPFEQPIVGGAVDITYQFAQTRRQKTTNPTPASAVNVYEGKIPDGPDVMLQGLIDQIDELNANSN